MISVDVPSETVTIESLRETELQEARAIQLAMLASEGLRTPQLTIESEFQPVTEVGGDFLDYFLLSDGTAGLYLEDVTGKGFRRRYLRRWRWERCAAYTKREPRRARCSRS